MTTPVHPDQLRISIEMGDAYQPSPRLRAALEELAAALGEAEGAGEVEGYLLQFEIQFKAFTYDSTLVPRPGGTKFRGPSGGSDSGAIHIKEF